MTQTPSEPADPVSDAPEPPTQAAGSWSLPFVGELGRIVRFGITGGGLFLLDLAIFLGLVDIIGVAWAQFTSVMVRSVVGFFAHKWFTFRGDTADTVAATAGQTVAYILQGVLNVPLSTAVVVGCVWLLGGWELGGKLLGEVVMLVEVFLLYRFVVYGRALFGSR